MRKTFKMQDLDCANCAAKMEDAIRKIDGVSYISISFMAQKMVIEADDSRFDAIMQDVSKAVRKVDKHCEVIL